MKTGIVFNGREYASRESMPPDVRKAYDEALSGLADMSRQALSESALGRALLPRDHSEHFLRAHAEARRAAGWMLPILLALVGGGMLVAGVWLLVPLNASLRSRDPGFAIRPGFLVAVTLTTAVAIVIAVMMMLMKRERPDSGDPEASPNQRLLRALDRTEHTLGRLLQLLVGAAAGGVIAGAVWMISNMDPSSRSQGGNVYVALGALVALACLAGMYVAVEMRRRK